MRKKSSKKIPKELEENIRKLTRLMDKRNGLVHILFYDLSQQSNEIK